MINDKNNNNEILFTDKYKPTKYIDLITEEKVNREILTWMKSWDEIVFNKKFNIPKIPINLNKNLQNQFPSKNNTNNINNNNNNNNTKNIKTLKNQIQYIEVDYVQSKHKIILISGPPGIGKTTLANIIASHCGYEPIIINASDERTTDKLITRIYDTTLINNININPNKKIKPTCLILDEIDGIQSDYQGRNSIKNIIDFIKTGKINKQILGKNKKEILSKIENLNNNNNNIKLIRKKTNNNKIFNNEENNNFSDDDDESNNNNNNNNENYFSDDEKFPTKKNKEKNSIVKRPIICICNDIYAKSLILLRKEALVYNIKKVNEKKIFDKLLKITNLEKIPIDSNTIHSIIEFSKFDMRTCLNCLQLIKYNMKNKIFINNIISDNNKLKIFCNKDFNENLFNVWNKIIYRNLSEPKLNYSEIYYLYNSSGEYGKIIEGLFSNYLNIPKKNSESDIFNRSYLSDLFSFEDCYKNSKLLSGKFINSFYSTDKFDKSIIEFPTLFYDINHGIKETKNVVNIIQNENNFLRNFKINNLICHFIPFLFQLIQPNFREINVDLMKNDEIQNLKNSINLMILCGIEFKENNNYEEPIQFYPDISKLLKFDYILPKNRLSMNQKIIMKNEYEKIKNIKNLEDDDKIEDINANNNIINSNKNKLNGLEQLSRIMGMKRKSNQISKTESKFIYKYHEGVTNCVKRTLNIRYFNEGNFYI